MNSDWEARFREAEDNLHRYMEDRRNPLSGPVFFKLVDEMFKAKDDLTSQQ